MPVKHILSTVLLLAAAFSVCAEPSTQWHFLGEGKNNAISGITSIDGEHFLVAIDGRKPEHPRLALLTWKKSQKPALNLLDWCDKNNPPVDLEAVTAIPNHQESRPKYREYLLLESKGSVTRIQLENNNSCKVTAKFDLPNAVADSNMEAIAIHCFGSSCLLAWAERGDDKTPAKLSWAHFNIEDNQLDEPENKPFEFKAPFPQQNLRSISDLAIDSKGEIWVSASSDPGDEGPYSSAIYHLGSFVQRENHIDLNVAKEIKPLARYEKENVKIEGLVFTPEGLLMGVENENLGGKVAILPIK